MVIKNKDGSIYKVRGPNPIMVAQDLWNDFELHNMEFPDDFISQNAGKKAAKPKINLGQTFTPQENEPKSVVNISSVPVKKEPEKKEEISIFQKENTPIIEPPPKEIEKSEPIEKPTSVNEKLLKYPKTVLCCLPTDVKEKRDALYGEVSTKITYGKKFTFEAILIEESDMHLLFWTHLDKIKRFAIFYPKNQEKRWWQADAIKQAPEGFIVKCIPSMHHPNF
jgi:hypothetical protein